MLAPIRPTATIRVKMGHFAPGNTVKLASCDCFQPRLIIAPTGPITLLSAHGQVFVHPAHE